MIDLKNICFSYDTARGAETLHQVSLHFAPGTFYGIVGPNGCGKTTLIRLIARLNRPYSGTMSLNGQPYASYSRRQFAKMMALMPQDRHIPELTAEELIALSRFPYHAVHHRLTGEDRTAIRQAMELTGTEPFASRSLAALSGGERQRVYLAMLLAQDTPCILLDEPTTYLDIANQFAVMDILRAARDRGKCVIAVLHDLPLALEYCDRLMVMDGGQVKFEGGPADAAASGVLEQTFGVRCFPAAQGETSGYIFRPVNKKI